MMCAAYTIIKGVESCSLISAAVRQIQDLHGMGNQPFGCLTSICDLDMRAEDWRWWAWQQHAEGLC